MADEKKPVAIKKYANRRLYHTGTSSYVTLEDLAQMVKQGQDFVVSDAKTGEDITRSVLAQIIFEQEGKSGQSLLPITFLRQLIRFYGDSMQMMVPSFLEFSIGNLTKDQQKFRDMGRGFGAQGLPGSEMFVAAEEQARKNMAMFSQALTMFNPFAAAKATQAAGAAPADSNDLDGLKKQLQDMQRQLDGLAKKE